MVKVSVIVYVQDSARSLEKTVKSVIDQTFKDIEIICIDNESFDDLSGILKAMSEYDAFRILNCDSAPDKARNQAIDEAKGDYISFLEAGDIFIDENALKLLYEFASKNNADMVCGNSKKLSGDMSLVDNPNSSYCRFDEYSTIGAGEYGIPQAFYKNIYKKSFLDKNNIRFKDFGIAMGRVFLAEVLTAVNSIYGVPVDFYAHAYPPKPYSNVNSPTLKMKYIAHYKEVSDIFDKRGFPQLSLKYKSEFMKYLNHSINSRNSAVYDFVMGVFGKDNGYFDDFKNQYDYFRVFHILNRLTVENTSSYFFKARDELKSIDLSGSEIVPKRLRENVELINSCSSFEEYKEKSLEFNLGYIEGEIESSSKRNNDYRKDLNSKRQLLNEKFNFFIIKYKNLKGESREDYFNDLKRDFITLKSNDLYRNLMDNLNYVNRKFLENVLNAQSFWEFDLSFENLMLEAHNMELEKQFNDLIRENENLENSKCFVEQKTLISQNTELSAKNRDLKIRFLKMDKNG